MRITEQELSIFHDAVVPALDNRINSLRDEINRLSFIYDNCDDWLTSYLSWEPSSAASATEQSDKSGKIDLSQFYIYRERDLHIFGEVLHGHRRGRLSKEKAKQIYDTRKKNLGTLLSLAQEYLDGFANYEISHAITQFTIYKHKDFNWKGDENLAHPYRPELLSPDKQASFLIRLYRTDTGIAGSLLSILARMHGTPSIIQYVSDNDNACLAQLLSNADVLISEEITAWNESLNLADIKDIDDILAASGSIQKDFFLMKFVEPLDNLWEGMQAISYKEWPAIGNGDRAGNFRPSQENSHPNEYQEPDPKDAEERKQYFVGLKDDLKNSNLLDQIVDALCARGDDEKGIDCIDVEDKAVLYYRFSGNKKPKELKKVKWHTKKSDRPGDNKKVRHPSELYYLLYHMYKQGVSDVQERVNEFFAFEDDETSELVKSAFKDQAEKKKSGIGTKGQSAPQSFQATMNSICPMVFPIKNKKK